ncbi:MAG: hypothetical protein K6G04_05940 [Lachnospiraceae bacterium]|nr:hypothetical protein [Lachnospiraceae bacterium]
MRFNKVAEITGLMFLFLKRNVLNIGLLKVKAFRAFMLGVLAVLVGFLSFELFGFFESTRSTVEQTSVVLDSYSCSIFMWTFLVFIFVKILFMKKGSFLEFTAQMPVTRKEKNLAVLVFEIITALSVVLLLSCSMIIALIVRDGAEFLTRIVCNILFNCVTIYFVFELCYSLLGLFFDVMGLKDVKNIIIICILSMLVVCFYLVIIPDVFLSILYTYKDHTGTAKILIYTVLAERYGLLASCMLFLAIVALLGLLIVCIPNNDVDGGHQYARIGGRRSSVHSMLWAYMKAFIRKADTINYYFIALFLYGMLLFMNMENAYYTILIVTLNALYAYVQTYSLRYVLMQKRYHVFYDYGLLVLSQVLYITLLSVPICVVQVVRSGSILFVRDLLVAIIFSVVFFTMAGILFPAKSENPFSAMMGILFLLIIGIMAVAVCFFLKLNEMGTMVVMFLLSVASILVSCIGMTNLYKKRAVYKF